MKGDPLKRPVLRWWAGGLLAGLCGLVAAQAAPANTQSIYTCVDKQGRKLTSDRPIPECIDREQRELSPTGTVRRVIGPTLTEHERAAREVERRKEQEERNRIADERKRERVLVARYPDKAAHDAERALAIAQVDAVTATATQRIAELQARRKTLDLEMEFYRKDPSRAPAPLRAQQAEITRGLEEQQRFIDGQQAERARIEQRFDEELLRLRVLWTGAR